MKKILNILFLMVLTVSLSAQTTLTFVGKDRTGQDYVQLSRVSVFDLDQLWYQEIYYPDTTLVLYVNGTVGVETVHAPSLQMQNTPNPFDGTTDVILSTPYEGDVTMEITDVNGRAVVETWCTASLQCVRPQSGTHQFRLTLSAPGTYVLTARQNGHTVSVKMVNAGNGGNDIIEYMGIVGANVETRCTTSLQLTPKSGTRGDGHYPFHNNDRMRYTGYAVVDDVEIESETVEKAQNGSETIPLKFDVARPEVVTNDATNVAATAAMLHGEVTADNNANVTERGFCYGTISNPNGMHTAVGNGMGTFSVSVNGLTPATTYYVRAYATNAVGTSFTPLKPFRTLDTLPVVTTTEPTDITATTFTSGGEVLMLNSNNLTARGICWNTTGAPTIADSHTTQTGGLGSFTSTVTGLDCGTTYYVRAYATNSAGTAYGEGYSVTTMPPTIPDVALPFATIYNGLNIVVQAEVLNDNCSEVTTRGLCWNDSPHPTTDNNRTANGNGIGSFSDTLIGLEPAITYYIRAYATNELGTAYSEEISVITPDYPAVTTAPVTDITSTTATSGGNVTSDGGATVTACGVCWSTSQNPTITDNRTTDGIGLGGFHSILTELSSGTTYYVRAYATNSVGTAYGEEYSFTTLALPTVITTSVTAITSSTATSGGNVSSDGGATVTARGVCWSTSPNPTVSNSHTTNGSGTGSFTSSLTGLTAGVTYYLRAYATNSVGTAYGNQVSFTTTFTCGTSTLTDRDGNTYNTVQIGTQCWMKENLRTTKYADGTAISQGSSTSTTTPYWYYPNNSSSNKPTYGLLYNWKAVMRNSSSSSANPSGVQGVCPTGWHVPSDAEWTQLTDYVSSQSQYVCGSNNAYIAKALAGTTGWSSSTGTCRVGNTPSQNNSTGFSALPAGYSISSYYGFGDDAYFWSATENASTDARQRYLYYNYAYVTRSYSGKSHGYSVRCVKD